MSTLERLQQIREHFATVSVEQFDQNLRDAGMEVIKSVAQCEYEEEMELLFETSTATGSTRQYNPNAGKQNHVLFGNYNGQESLYEEAA